MKTILLLILSAFTACAATTYPVLTDNANRTFSGGGTNLALLNGTNVFAGTNTFNTNLIFGSSTLQTQLDSKPTVALTNVARLDQSQTWTGTPTFPAGVFASNNIGMRLLWSSSTNIYLPSVSTNQNATNNGDFYLTTSVLDVSLPPLLGSNSAVAVWVSNLRSNSNPTTCSLFWYLGPSTNFVGNGVGASSSAGVTAFNSSVLFQNAASMTNQWQGSGISFPVFYGISNLVDTSSTFRLMAGACAASASGHTNLNLIGLKIYELYAP